MMLPGAAILPDVARGAGFVVLLLPVALAFAGAAHVGRDRVYGAAVGLAGGMAALTLGGIVLSVAAEVTPVSWLVWLLIVDAAILIGWLRRVGARGFRRPGLSLDRLRVPLIAAALGAAALALAVAAIAFSRASARDADARVTFSELWLLPRSATRATVGVRNVEGRTTSYRLEVRIGGRMLLDRDLTLSDSATLTEDVPLPRTRTRQQVTATLFRADSAAPYRRAHVWTLAR